MIYTAQWLTYESLIKITLTLLCFCSKIEFQMKFICDLRVGCEIANDKSHLKFVGKFGIQIYRTFVIQILFYNSDMLLTYWNLKYGLAASLEDQSKPTYNLKVITVTEWSTLTCLFWCRKKEREKERRTERKDERKKENKKNYFLMFQALSIQNDFIMNVTA